MEAKKYAGAHGIIKGLEGYSSPVFCLVRYQRASTSSSGQKCEAQGNTGYP